jgi:molybdate transport system substrate-binding protein
MSNTTDFVSRNSLNTPQDQHRNAAESHERASKHHYEAARLQEQGALLYFAIAFNNGETQQSMGQRSAQMGLLALLALLGGQRCVAEPAQVAHIAVAANFAEPIKAIAAELKKTTGHSITVTLGSTGKLYAQIQNGAPFDMLLSADTQTPSKLEKMGLTQPGSRFTYATGKLVLWSANTARVNNQGDVLKLANLGKVAFANPKTAPYGLAAAQVMDKLGLSTVLAPKLVQGESIGQTYTFTATGNADVGFVALSQVLQGGHLKSGSMWVIPRGLYEPIRQDAVVLKRGADNKAALALVQLLKSPPIKDLIRSYGYEL